MPLAAPDISATLPSLPVIDILPDLNFHYGVSLSGQFALQHVFDEAVNSSALVTSLKSDDERAGIFRNRCYFLAPIKLTHYPELIEIGRAHV